ncbi:MAG: aldo/keto reductase [Dactylosporangium sp.]|nr:aldo/keto reductase [Dactylosporangium sp.]NNJ62982.1 aldo/keto reductase [Dactylosporangium sp.]
MRYRFLGRTGLKVSELGLGAMTFGRELDEQASFQILDKFAAAGGNFIDTADAYSGGASEEILGHWLRGQPRQDFVVATKVRWPSSDRPNDAGLSRKHILDAVAASLRRLGTDYIDLYQVHAWDGATALEETLSTLDSLVRSGMVRYVGASNYSGWQLQKAVDLCQRHGWQPFASLQPLYNLLDREAEWELLPVCRGEGLGVVSWSPLRGGWLGGRLRPGMTTPPDGTRVKTAERLGWGESWTAYHNDHTWRVIEELFAVAEETEREVAQVAINWVLNRPGVTAPITGARTLEQLTTNLGAVGWELSADQEQRLSAVSTRPLPYPYNIVMADPERI